MKKLLLVLLVVALASFLLVGCNPAVPDDGDDGDDGVVPGICPTITIAGSYTDPVKGWTYVKGDDDLEVVVTFAQPTEGASIYMAGGIFSIMGVEELADKAGMFDLLLPSVVSADGKTYTAKIPESWLEEYDDCEAFTILVEGCDVCVCSQSFVVDWDPPYVEVEICVDGCTCAGCTLSFTSTIGTDCDETANCGDDCSGVASWTIAIYDEYPFEDCCDIPCVEPMDDYSGTACPVSWTTECIEFDDLEWEDVFVLVTLVDNVGNDVKYGAWVYPCDYDTCDEVGFMPWGATDCIDDAIWDDVFSVCEDHECGEINQTELSRRAK